MSQTLNEIDAIPLSEWPRFSDGGKYLCFVREADGYREHGFVIAGAWEMNIGYVWDGGTGDFIQYKSSDEILLDGWRVD